MKTDSPVPRGTRAILAAFAAARAEGRAALITYLTAGYPTPAHSPELLRALTAGGADLLEVGVPFSDSVADGPTIQNAAHAALRAGVTPQGCLHLVAGLRAEGADIPILLMGYYNPILTWGPQAFARACHGAGVDGLIVPDLPPEEAAPLQEACRGLGLSLVFMVAPTTSPERISRIAAATEGFLYLISRLGTTGAEEGQAPAVEPALVERLSLVRRLAHTPVALGFGLSRSEQLHALAPLADGLIVGSAIVERSKEGAEALRTYVEVLRSALYYGLAAQRHSL